MKNNYKSNNVFIYTFAIISKVIPLWMLFFETKDCYMHEWILLLIYIFQLVCTTNSITLLTRSMHIKLI